MGDQNDGLRGLTRFSDNEGDIIWPAWRAELEQRVAFEFGKIGNQIIEGEVKESDVDLGEVTEKINALINALIPRTRAQIQTRSDWMEEFVMSSEEGASDEVRSIKKTKLTLIGNMAHFFGELHQHETEFRRFQKRREGPSTKATPVQEYRITRH